jgi:hypothetical protein
MEIRKYFEGTERKSLTYSNLFAFSSIQLSGFGPKVVISVSATKRLPYETSYNAVFYSIGFNLVYN